ncbi:uncharacterized protein [Drosophila takahashii]|uniref:uncharacterized protein n=1 Tax=Drosophila takahashii TaxID=29030 RepID=UPI0038993DFB
MPSNTSIVDFADDVTLVVVSMEVPTKVAAANSAIQAVEAWHSVPESGGDGGDPGQSQRALKYLGVMLDTRLSFREHLEYANKKARETTRSLCRILLNTRVPKQDKRILLASVVKSQLLYAPPVWAEATDKVSYMRKVNSTYRLCAIRISCAFRTISDDAVLVIAGQVPLGELVRESKDIRTTLSLIKEDPWTKAEARARSRMQSVDYYLTHGCFRSFLKQYGHETEDSCPECGCGIAEDVLFECHRFNHKRQVLEEIAGARVLPEILVP